MVSVLVMYAVVVGVMFAVGAMLIPGIIYLLGKDLPGFVRGILSRILFVEGQIAFGGGLLVELPTGQYEMKYVYGDGEDAHIRHDGAEYPVDTTHSAWSRLGLRRFATAVLVTEDMTDDVFVDGAAATDGGIGIVNRNGVNVAIPGADQLRAFLPKVYDRIGSAGRTDSSDRVKEVTMRKHGGDQRTSEWLFLGAFMACIALGILTGMLL